MFLGSQTVFLYVAAQAGILLAVTFAGYSDLKTRTVHDRYALIVFFCGFFIIRSTFSSFCPHLAIFLSWDYKLAGLLVAGIASYKLEKYGRSGGADIKMYSALGFAYGIIGLIVILFFAWLIEKLRNKTKGSIPMCFYLSLATYLFSFLILASIFFENTF